MPDIALEWLTLESCADMVVDHVANDLATDNGLRTAAMTSLLTDRRADQDEEIPDGTTNRRGWWGDEYLENPGDRMGSKLWLLDRSKKLPGVRRDIQDHARQALAWMVEDKIAASVEPTAIYLTAAEIIALAKAQPDVPIYLAAKALTDGYLLTIAIHRPATIDAVRFRYALNWAAELGGNA